MLAKLMIGGAALVALTMLVSGCGLGGDEVSGWPDVDLGADRVELYKSTDERDLYVHVFEPVDAAEPVPAVLFFHGGGFRVTRVPQFEHQARAVAEQGIAGVVVEYRVTAEGTTRADAIADGMDALAVVQGNAERFGIDGSRLAMAGSSAGGTLAVEAGASAQALVLFNPAVDAPSAGFVEGQPTIVFHSREDTIVPIEAAERFCDAVEMCELVEFATGDHGFFNFEPELTETTRAMTAFLHEQFSAETNLG